MPVQGTAGDRSLARGKRSSRDLMLVVGARPNFVKAGPVFHAAREQGRFSIRLVHTGQHYDANLSERILRQLGLPEPDVSLGVGSGSHGVQTAEVMRRLEPILAEERPACVVVFGDVNSTLAATLTAVKLHLPVAHVEAGLRSFDNAMPEEINRRLTDCVSDLLLTTEESGNQNLRREGVAEERILFVGNTMVDSLRKHLGAARARRAATLDALGVAVNEYAVLTFHRPSNVDEPRVLARILEAVGRLSRHMPVILPLHPRTRLQLQRGETGDVLSRWSGIRSSDPLPYLDFLGLLDGARLVLTDSGGIQEETTALGVPCLTLRDNTERPVTITHGTNRLVGNDPLAIRAATEELLAAPALEPPPPPPLWDGHAAERIVEALVDRYGG